MNGRGSRFALSRWKRDPDRGSIQRAGLPGGESAIASSDPDGGFAAAHPCYERRIGRGAYDPRRIADRGLTWLTRNSFTESGAGGYGPRTDRLEQTVLTINHVIEFGRAFASGARTGLARPRFGNGGIDRSGFEYRGHLHRRGRPSCYLRDRTGGPICSPGSAARSISPCRTTTLQADLDALLADQYQIGAGLRVEYRF